MWRDSAAPFSSDAMSEPILAARGLTKRFPGVVALSNVNFAARAGEVHALMGENGAGKSTLIKCLTGVYPRDDGTLTLAGSEINPRSPREAEVVGISTVYQEVNLLPDLSVAENICLGRQSTVFGFLSWGAMRARARAALARLGLTLDVAVPLSSHSIAIQQLVALARAIDVAAKVLILDEPTSSLDEREVAELFTIVRRLRAEGMAIIFVSHFLDQVYEIADRITVLRNGGLVGEFLAAELPRLQLVAHMMGRDVTEIEAMHHRPSAAPPAGVKPPVLAVRGFGRRASVKPLNLSVHAGEVLGFAGLLGSGRTELARLLFGIDQSDEGTMEIDGQPASVRSPQAALARRFAFTPEDRKSSGILPNLTVRENLLVALQVRRGLWQRVPRAEQDALVAKFTAALGIKTSGPAQLIKNLSGGNQQKVILSRWLATEPRLLILDEPTRGIDVGAQADIERLIGKFRDEGLAVILICSETAELARNSQRVVVLRDRGKVAELSGAEVNEHAIIHAIAAEQSAQSGPGT